MPALRLYTSATFPQIQKKLNIYVRNAHIINYTCAIYQQIQRLFVILVPNASTRNLLMCHMSVNTEDHNLYLCQMPVLLSYTYTTCQNTQRPLIYTFAKCYFSSVTHVPYFGRYRDPLVILVPNAGTLL